MGFNICNLISDDLERSVNRTNDKQSKLLTKGIPE